jgi:hypothetical protein
MSMNVGSVGLRPSEKMKVPEVMATARTDKIWVEKQKGVKGEVDNLEQRMQQWFQNKPEAQKWEAGYEMQVPEVGSQLNLECLECTEHRYPCGLCYKHCTYVNSFNSHNLVA